MDVSTERLYGGAAGGGKTITMLRRFYGYRMTDELLRVASGQRPAWWTWLYCTWRRGLHRLQNAVREGGVR